MTPALRLAQPDDAASIAKIYRPIVESTAISFEVEAPDANAMRARIVDELVTHPWLVAEIEGEVAGYAYATAHRTRQAYQWSVDTSAYVHPRFQRRGVGRSLYQRLFEILVAQGFCTAYAGIALPNPASVGLHESVGFTAFAVYRKVGFKLSEWHDVGWWQRALQPHPANPQPPRPLREVAGVEI